MNRADANHGASKLQIPSFTRHGWTKTSTTEPTFTMRRASTSFNMMRRSSSVISTDSSDRSLLPTTAPPQQQQQHQQQDQREHRWQKRRTGDGQKRRRRRPKVRRRVPVYAGAAVLMFLILMMFLHTNLPSRVLDAYAENGDGGDSHSHSHSDRRDEESRKFRLEMDSAPSCDEPLEAKDITFTLVSQFSSDRIWMMEHHCQRWATDGRQHKMSLAILSNQTHDETLQTLLDLGCDSSKIALTVVDARKYPYDDYPVNVLRNVAFEQAKQTTHMVYVDVDFWESRGLHEVLSSDGVSKSLADDPQLALVVPAFQLWRQCREWKDCRDKNIPLMPHTKQDLLKLLKSKKANMFDPTNPGGHGTTDYPAWIKQETGSLLEIPCLKSKRYEPFLVMRRCRELPPFQEQFSGYGKNKMTWMMQLLRSGYNLAQVGGVYLVHYPHLDSASRQTWNLTPKSLATIHKDEKGNRYKLSPKDVKADFSQYKRGQVDKMYVEFKAWLSRAVEDRTRLPVCDTAQDDDAKLWVGRKQGANEQKGKEGESDQT